MPVDSLHFRAHCGQFLSTFLYFMTKRAGNARKMWIRVISVRCRMQGVMVGLIIAVFFSGGDLLQRCGDVEMNPGPPKPNNTMQTRLNSWNRSNSAADRHSTAENTSTPTSRKDITVTEPELTLKDVMAVLTSVHSKVDELKTDMKEIKESYDSMKSDVEDMKEAMAELATENTYLKTQLGDLARKTDDLECRSKRNNIILHGLPRSDDETPQDCEDTVRELLTDKLEMAEDVQFDRVHRLSGKPNSPIVARCSFYKHREKILKERNKLKGSNIFIGEDFSLRVREIRKKLIPHLKTARNQGKRATMVYDHLLIDGRKLFLDKNDELIEHSHT